jgi:hypothetical protein
LRQAPEVWISGALLGVCALFGSWLTSTTFLVFLPLAAFAPAVAWLPAVVRFTTRRPQGPLADDLRRLWPANAGLAALFLVNGRACQTFAPPGPHENFGMAFELIAVLVQLVSLGGAGLLLLAFRKTRRAGTHALIALALLLVAWLISTLLPPLSVSE